MASIVMRLAVLWSLPATASHLAVHQRSPSASAEVRRIEFLQSRVLILPLTEDEHSYDEIGRNIADGRGFVLDSKWLITTPGQPVIYAGFTYPAFVGLIYWLFGSGSELPVFLIQVVLAGVGAWWVVAAAGRTRGADAGVIAGAFYTFHPTLIWSSLAMMSESLCVPLVAILMYLLAKRSQHEVRRVVALAVLLALLCLARSTFAYFVWIVAALLWFEARKRRPWYLKLRPSIAFLLACGLFISPWTIRNYVHWHRIIPLSTKAGVNAWMHNNPGLKVELGLGADAGPAPVDVYDPSIQNLRDEPARNARLMQLFLGFLKSHPAKFVGLVLMRLLIAILPIALVSKSVGALISAWYAKGLVLLVGLVSLPVVHRHTLWRIAPWLLFVGYWTGMQSLAGAGLRYRLPADPAWACILGVLCAAVLARVRRRLPGRGGSGDRLHDRQVRTSILPDVPRLLRAIHPRCRAKVAISMKRARRAPLAQPTSTNEL